MKNRTLAPALAALAGVGALALGSTTVLMAGTAHAASADLGYSCKIPILGAKTFQVSLDTDAPDTATVGDSIKNLSVNVVPDPSALKLAYTLGARQFEGETTFTVNVGGTDHDVKATTPRSDIASDGSVPPTSATLPLNAKLTAAGPITVRAGKIQIEQKVYDKDGKPFAMSPSASIPCTPPADADLTVDTLTVKGVTPPVTPPVKPKAKTVTVLKAKAGKARIKVNVRVKHATSGKVKLTLKGPKKVTKMVALKKGKASVVLKKLKKGKYKLTAAYQGTKTTKPSKKKGSVRVRR